MQLRAPQTLRVSSVGYKVTGSISNIQEVAECLQKKVLLLVWLQQRRTALITLGPIAYHPSFVANILQSPVP